MSAEERVSYRDKLAEGPCVFCDIVLGEAPARVVADWPDALAFVPLNPVTDGHVLVVPKVHVPDAAEDPAVTAVTMARAAELAATFGASNILTSVGRPATQSIFHLHIHVIRRTVGDQLMVPWGTTGNPHDPHLCKRAERAEAAIERTLAYCAEFEAALSVQRLDVPSWISSVRAALGQPPAEKEDGPNPGPDRFEIGD